MPIDFKMLLKILLPLFLVVSVFSKPLSKKYTLENYFMTLQMFSSCTHYYIQDIMPQTDSYYYSDLICNEFCVNVLTTGILHNINQYNYTSNNINVNLHGKNISLFMEKIISKHRILCSTTVLAVKNWYIQH